MARTRRKVNLLEITTGFTAVAGTSLTANVGPAVLNDGEIYELHIPPGIALPVGLTGGEAFQITIANNPTATIIVGDRRARNVLSERVRRYRIIRMLFTQDSIITQGETATPAFIAFAGIVKMP